MRARQSLSDDAGVHVDSVRIPANDAAEAVAFRSRGFGLSTVPETATVRIGSSLRRHPGLPIGSAHLAITARHSR